MARETRRLTTGELVAGACAILLVLDLFLHWYSLEAARALLRGQQVTTPFSGWRDFRYTDVFLTLFSFGVLAVLFVQATGRAARSGINPTLGVIALGGLSTLLVFLRLVNPPGPNSFVSREIGVYLGFLLCLGITIGGFVGIRQRGMTTAEARDQARSVFSGRGKSRPAGEDDA